MADAPDIERLLAYHQALGRFVHAFAIIEALTQSVVCYYAGITLEEGRAIFGPLCINEAMAVLNRLVAARNVSAKRATDLEDVFRQLGRINSARNDILHYGAVDPSADVDLILGTGSMMIISPEILAMMTEDLMKIAAHLMAFHTGRHIDRAQAVRADIRAAWRYKPLRRTFVSL
jgi:hypothetical protein